MFAFGVRSYTSKYQICDAMQADGVVNSLTFVRCSDEVAVFNLMPAVSERAG